MPGESKRPEDERIVEKYFARDEEAIALTRDKYGKILSALIGNLLENKEDAEECLDDVLLKIWQSVPPNRPAHLGAYCAKIARSTALDRIRRDRAARRIPPFLVDDLDKKGEISSGRGTEDEVTGRELSALLDRFLGDLKKRDRLIFLYRRYFGKQIGEIARLCSVSCRTVSASLAKTEDKLENYLKKEGYFP